MCSESASDTWRFSLRARIHGSRNPGVETVVAPLTITPSDPLTKCLLPFPMASRFAGPEVLIPKAGMLVPGDTTTIPLNWKLKLPRHHCGLLEPQINNQKREFPRWQG